MTRAIDKRLLVVLAILAVLFLMDTAEKITSGVKDLVQTHEIEQSILSRGVMGKIMRELGLLGTSHTSYVPEQVTHPEKATVLVEMEVAEAGIFQVFWSHTGEPFNVDSATDYKLEAGANSFLLRIPLLDELESLRVDPINKPVSFRIERLSLLQQDAGEFAIVDNGRLHRAARLRGGLHPIRSDGLFEATEEDPSIIINVAQMGLAFNRTFEKRKNASGLRYHATLRSSAANPSRIDRSLLTDVPTISLAVAEEHLNDAEMGILANRYEHGKAWERPVLVSFYQNGKLQFSMPAGIRFHGGKSRKRFESFRIYFRESWGSGEKQPQKIFGQERRLRTLVIHHVAWPEGMPLSNSLSYLVCEMLGCTAPRNKLARFVLNGEDKGLVLLVEHPSRRQWRDDEDREMDIYFKFKFRNTNKDQGVYQRTFFGLIRSEEPLSMGRVAEHIDLDSMTAYLLTYAYVGNTDPCQGAIVRSQDPGSRLKFIAWDLDHGFAYSPAKKTGHAKPAWQDHGIDFILRRRCPPMMLAKRLLKDDPNFRVYFKKKIDEALDRILRPEALEPHLARFGETLRRMDYPDWEGVGEEARVYFRERPDELRKQLSAVDVFHSG